MLLSVIIPTLNEEKYLPRLLKSLKGQTFLDFEIIISDGGSTDKTKEIAAYYECKFIEDNKHKHPSWQRNNGAEIAVGETLLFLDADIILQPEFLTKILEEFVNKKYIGSGFYIKFNPNKATYVFYAGLFNFFCFLRQYFAPAAVGSAILAQRSAHEKINGFDTSLYMAEDFDYCYRLSRQGRFRMIKSSRILHSSRRLEKEGSVIVGLKWSFMALFTLFNFKIKRKIVNYEFGKY